ncbi:hypothetical protein [Salinimicrobium sp. HB62]|uniref:hypothetical protein n=1 Tax=Salinimicrobium sp. HB62 TaxID=3077781 RepID=UPI002D78AA86|nr:hypothetical protein [Salinimicrobium sp. HB62]
MKKLLLLLLPMLLLTSCSIEEPEVSEDSIKDLNASFQAEGCDIVILEYFGDYGQLHITNDNENLYLLIAAEDGFALENLKLHIAEDYSGFPTVGKGNLPPGQMEINLDFSPSVQYHELVFSLEELNFGDNQKIVLAAKGDFTDGTESYASWVGDIQGPNGNWFYMNYDIQECPIVEDPCENYYSNVSSTLCTAQVDDISLLGVTNYYKNQIFLSTSLKTITGTFNPTMAELLDQIKSGSLAGEYNTVYTVDTPECGFVSFEISVLVNECL